MPVNTRTEYALRTMLELMNSRDVPISVNDISKNQRLPRKYIEHLLVNLKTSGLVNSTSGSRGGYTLAKSPEEIKLSDVVDAVEDHSWEFKCNAKSSEFCMGTGCALHDLWDTISMKLRDVLQEYNLHDIEAILYRSTNEQR